MSQPAKKPTLKDYDKEKALAQADSRISRVRSSLLLSDPFFGALALRLKPRAVDLMVIPGKGARLMTMATDGEHFFYSPMWMTTITDAELKGVYKHEVLHCALGHPYRVLDRDPEKFNIAADGAINRIILKQAGAVLPKGAVDFASFKDLTKEQYETFNSEQLYPHVKDRPQQQSAKGSGTPQDGAGSAQDDGGGDEGDTPIESLPWGSVVPAPASNSNGKTRAEQEADWKVAAIQAAQAAKLQGRLPADLEQLVAEVTRNRVDWKSLTRRFVQQVAQSDYSWRRPNARYTARGLYLPYMHDEKIPPIVVCFDTSGSCWNDQGKFFAELNNILEETKPEKVYFIECDAAVHEPVKELAPGDEIKPTVHGGGGTSFVPPFEWIKRQGIEPACMIYLTDTYGDFPQEQPPYPVMWAITEKGRESQCPEWSDAVVYLGDDD